MTSTTAEAQITPATLLSDHPKWPTTHLDASNMALADPPQSSLDTCSPQQYTMQLETDPQMIWSHDDQLALMGLTGLDILEFDAFSHMN
jgi:hypothetical protein